MEEGVSVTPVRLTTAMGTCRGVSVGRAEEDLMGAGRRESRMWQARGWEVNHAES